MVAHDHEADDAAARGEVVPVPHRQDAAGVHQAREIAETSGLRAADEQHVRRTHLLRRRPTSHHDRMTMHGLAGDDLVEAVSEGIRSHDAEHERRVRALEGVGRPFHELGEVVEERRLEVVLARRAPRARRRPRRNRDDQQHHGREAASRRGSAVQKRHSTLP